MFIPVHSGHFTPPPSAIELTCDVASYGPPTGIGLSQLKAGYIQNVKFNLLRASYVGGGIRIHPIETKGLLLDSMRGQTKGWAYDGTALGYKFTSKFTNMGVSYGIIYDLSFGDTPSMQYPIYKIGNILASTTTLLSYNNYVAAGNTEQQNEIGNYVLRSELDWYLNLNGVYDTVMHVWEPSPSAGITYPDGWGSVVNSNWTMAYPNANTVVNSQNYNP